MSLDDSVHKDFAVALPEYFTTMLDDVDRNISFGNAIGAAIAHFVRWRGRKPRVLDLGCGSGMLSAYALEHGAEFVVGIEANAERAKLARENVCIKKYGAKCRIVTCLSTDFTLAMIDAIEPFDMLVCELIGAVVHYERMSEFIADLYDRNVVRTFLVGHISHYVVPQRMQMWIQQYQRRTTEMNMRTNRDGVDILAQSCVEKKAFHPCREYGITLHNEQFEPIGDAIRLIDQDTWSTLQFRSSHVKLAPGALKQRYFVAEWKCQLWHEHELVHTVSSASLLYSYNFYARHHSWGFDVFAPNMQARSVTFGLTRDYIDVAIRNANPPINDDLESSSNSADSGNSGNDPVNELLPRPKKREAPAVVNEASTASSTTVAAVAGARASRKSKSKQPTATTGGVFDNFSDIADEGGVYDNSGEKSRNGFILFGLWTNTDNEFWVGYGHCNRMKQILQESREDTFTFETYAEFMQSRDNQWLSMFPWRTVKELCVLRARHPLHTWMTLWTMSVDQLWSPQYLDAHPHMRAIFESRRREFLVRHVAAMWHVTTQYCLVHLDEHSEKGAFDRLSNGFICFPVSVAPEFFSDKRMQSLMTPQVSNRYPWKTGVEAVAVIRRWRLIDKKKLFRDLLGASALAVKPNVVDLTVDDDDDDDDNNNNNDDDVKIPIKKKSKQRE